MIPLYQRSAYVSTISAARSPETQASRHGVGTTAPALITPETFGETVVTILYEDASLASVNRAAHVAACEAYADQVERLALSLNTRDPDILAEALWGEDCPGQPAHPDHL